MKKLLAVLLALSMVIGLVPAMGEAAGEPDRIPQVGDVVYGFEAREIRPFETYGADLVLFEHQKTGAKLMYIANGDTNRAFQLTFLTKPYNDRGLPHVFEHATMYGSEKYPSRSIYFNASYQTYNTYMNAYTSDIITSYPVASLSEAQLLALADWYTDSCFHPNIMTDESIYKVQAWHYEMTDAEAPLTVEGTVYSEMTGSLTLDNMALYNANRKTFPGASLTYEYGGIPESIMEMSWDELKAYHDLYYHPSNCIAVLYGEFEDYSAFLKLLDAEFSKYEKREFSMEEPAYQRITEPVISTVPYAVAEGTDTANQSTVYYYVVLPGLRDNLEEQEQVDHLCSMLTSSGSPLTQNLLKAIPTGTFSVGREMAAPDDAICFTLYHVNPEDAGTFVTVVNDTLKDIAENGFDPALADALATNIRISNKLAAESGNPVENLMYKTVYYYAASGNPFDYAESLSAYDRLPEENEQGVFQQAIRKWLLDPELYTLTTTYPAPGEKEKADAALADRLAEIKSGMSEEEIQQIVAETNAEPEEDNAEIIASLQAVDVTSLPEEVRTYESTDTTGEDGVRRINVTAGVDGIGEVEIFLDARTLPQEDIHYMRLFTRLLGKMDTDTHTREELSVLMGRYLYSGVLGVSVNSGEEASEVQPYVVAQWIALDEDLAAGYDLVKELLFHTSFRDLQALAENISAQKASVRSQISGSPYNVSLYRALGVGSMSDRYYAYMNFLEYYTFLEELEQQLAEDPEAVAARLEGVQSFFANRAGAAVGFAGNAESIALNQSLADAFLAELGDEKREKAELNLPMPAMAEGVIVDTNSGFNTLAADYTTLGLEEDGGMDVICALLNDRYLVPTLRDQMGVYTPWFATYPEKGIYAITYRDPNVKDTFEVYRQIPDVAAAMEVSQEELDGYIMSTFSSLAQPEGELAGAVKEMERILEGKDPEYTLKKMKAVKSVTPESVNAAAETFRILWEKGYRGTAAGAGQVQENADLYETVLNPFGAVDTSEVVLADVAEDREDFEAVRFAYENGLMALTGEDTFSPDDAATAGDLYGALYVLIGGGSNAVDEAIATFSQFGMVPEGVEAGTELTFEIRNQIMGAFGAAIGMELPTLGEGREADAMTRGELAQDLTMFGDE